MRATKPPEEIRQRYLGEIAPLLAAARPVESLSPERRKKLRRRILRTLFGTRHLGLRARLLPVLAALALLIAGGAAFATAQRWGLLPRLGQQEVSAPDREATPEARRRKGRARASSAPATEAQAAAGATAPAQPAIVLPVVPDPLRDSETAVGAAPVGVPPAKPSAEEPRPDTASPATPLPPKAPRLGAAKGARRAAGPGATPSSELAAPARDFAHVPAPITPAPSLVPGWAGPLAAAPAAGSAVTPPAPAPASAPAVAPPSPIAPPPPLAAPIAPVEHPRPARDQALFGQALRKLRSDNDPKAALAALREHVRVYPKSAFAGERTVLEVEALLALHRDREALALLDGMALDDLPRSGERLVVRGELRAAAKRWPEAGADFERALARVSGSPAWHERALWGRGVSRLRLGEREAGLADIERYRALYPKGRFAAEAARFFPGP